MEKKTIYPVLLALSFVGFLVSVGWGTYADLNGNDFTIPLIFIVINGIGMIASALSLSDIDKKTPVSEKELDKLHSFGREESGSYSDWCDFSIVPETNKHGSVTRWSFCLFNEVDGKTTFVRYVDNMQQLKDVYKGITNKELE
jgi:hypothetical protein